MAISIHFSRNLMSMLCYSKILIFVQHLECDDIYILQHHFVGKCAHMSSYVWFPMVKIIVWHNDLKIKYIIHPNTFNCGVKLVSNYVEKLFQSWKWFTLGLHKEYPYSSKKDINNCEKIQWPIMVKYSIWSLDIFIN